MSDNAVTPNVFLDTEVFDGQNLNFASRNLVTLARLAAAGKVRLFLTTVTKREIEKHLDEHAAKAFKTITTYRRASHLVKKLLPAELVAELADADEEAIRQGVREEFNTFVEQTQAEVLAINEVCPEAIFEQYFEQKAPFGKGQKKSEFPDAFAFASLQAWCDRSKEQMYIVSADPDWKHACRDNAALIHIARLEVLLEQYTDSVVVTAIKEFLTTQKQDIEERIKSKAENLDYFVSDSLIDGECEDIEVEVAVEDFRVVDATEGDAVVTAFCTLNVSASVTADDPNSLWSDPDTGDMRSVWHLRGTIQQDIEMDVSLNVTYDEQRLEAIAIRDIEFERKSIELDVDERELSCSDEDEYDEPDFMTPEEL